ncbi:RimK family alpha-L-glutamate ligase [Catenuloplanes sp. NPDC051500]|uniref:RimK family alpha-L-glutamate ligase n=1 Tax=Catenuloplanes sp. NPDC051500 TaxID=3363959 RepID=UPI0037A0C50E
MTTLPFDDTATRAQPRVAVVTAEAFPDLELDDRLILAPLATAGIAAEPVVWTDPDADWTAYDLVLLRSPWDYTLRRADFLAWAGSLPRLLNPADVVVWNTEKTYLRELAAAGVPVTETQWIGGGDVWTAPEAGEWVVKPAIGAGSVDAGRYDCADPEQRELAELHVERLLAAARLAMVQPYLSAVDTDGETALLYFTDPATGRLAYSHAIRKGAMLTGPDTGMEGLYRQEQIDPRVATDAQRAVAERALAAIPGGEERLLYARVDLLPGPGGDPVVVELELTEPSLFFGYDQDAATRFAAAVSAHITR